MSSVGTLRLPSGSMPHVGYGYWKVPRETCAGLVEAVIRAGYRHIDGACDYGNEKEVGEGIRRALQAGVCTRQGGWNWALHSRTSCHCH